MDWYEEYIEESIRSVVKLLRDNGFNTECSCGHDMYVQCQYLLDGEIKRLHDLLFNNGYRNYVIDVLVQVLDGHLYPSIEVRFEKERDKHGCTILGDPARGNRLDKLISEYALAKKEGE
jgi:hypothetical protein